MESLLRYEWCSYIDNKREIDIIKGNLGFGLNIRPFSLGFFARADYSRVLFLRF